MWNPSLRMFRRLVIIAVILHAANCYECFHPTLPAPEEYERAVQRFGGVGAWFDAGQWLRFQMLTTIGVGASLLGCLKFWNVARWGLLFFIAVSAAAVPCFGLIVSGPWSNLLATIAWLAIQTVAGIAFLSPLADRFVDDDLEAQADADEVASDLQSAEA